MDVESLLLVFAAYGLSFPLRSSFSFRRASRRPENQSSATRRMASGIEELERWLRLRAVVEQLVRRGGTEALRSAWYSGLRNTACNWGVFVVEQRGDRANWPAYLMHCWSKKLACEVKDAEIEALSRKNATLTRWSLG